MANSWQEARVDAIFVILVGFLLPAADNYPVGWIWQA